MANVLYVAPFGSKMDTTGRAFDFERIYSAIRNGLLERFEDDTIQIGRAESISTGASVEWGRIFDGVDLVLCDITTHNPNCLYELGFARGRGVPTLVIAARSSPVPLDVSSTYLLSYDPDLIGADFLGRLSSEIIEALRDPEGYLGKARKRPPPNRVFISYSHRDGDYLERLKVHLRPLEKAGLIDSWVDTRLKAGDRWKAEIERALKSARVAIILVSPDFLASDFVVDKELPPILEKAEVDGTRIIPIILHPCRFARDPDLSRFQAINSPSAPLSMLDRAAQEKVFDAVAEQLEESIKLSS